MSKKIVDFTVVGFISGDPVPKICIYDKYLKGSNPKYASGEDLLGEVRRRLTKNWGKANIGGDSTWLRSILAITPEDLEP